MTDPPKSTHRRWKTYIQLLLQVMAVLLVAISGWLGWILYTAKVQHEAVVAIEKAGGSVSYDWNLRDGPLIPTPKPWWLKWLVDHLGADCFGNVIAVKLGERGSDAELALVNKLRMVDQLNAGRSAITDAGLVHLTGLTRLSDLNIGGTAITNAGLTQLHRLTNLQHLDLYGTGVTDDGLVHLKGLKTLQFLNLTDTRVTDAGLTHLHGLTNLRTLGVWKSDVTQAGVQQLKMFLPLIR